MSGVRIILTIIMMAMTACAPATSQEDIQPIEEPMAAQAAPSPGPETSMSISDSEQQALEAAQADLSDRLGLPEENIQPVSIEPVEWSDASLGCPQEGMMYAQVVTPGYLIILEAEGRQYEYHTDRKANLVLCET